MTAGDPWGPPRRAVRNLERLARHRAAIEAVEPADDDQTYVRTHLLEILDVMEEALCEPGRRIAFVAEGWQELETWEPLLLNGNATKED